MGPPVTAAASSRLYGVDLLKGVASQLIVIHHMSVYGPLSDAAAKIAPTLTTWAFDYGRMVVQVFLVMGGFLAARAFGAGKGGLERLPGMIARRYMRLLIPYVAALGFAMAGAALADVWMDDPSIPPFPSLTGLLANVFMLQNILGYDSVLAGGWYIAIDFQLFALTAILFKVGGSTHYGRIMVLLLAVASLFIFNRYPALDAWGIYFYGSYGLGAAAWWFSEKGRSPAWLAAATALTVVVLVMDFRIRILIALCVALGLAVTHSTGVLDRWRGKRVTSFFARIAFALFLVHFPILLLANAVYVRVGLDSPVLAVGLLATAGAASLGTATLFHRLVEVPLWDKRLSNAVGDWRRRTFARD